MSICKLHCSCRHATFISATSDHGTVSGANGNYLVNIGALTNGEVAVYTLVVKPTNAITFTNTAVIVRTEAEFYTGNNSATNVVTGCAVAESNGRIHN